jgi:hypothetical protein
MHCDVQASSSESLGSDFQLNNFSASRLRCSDNVPFGGHFESLRERYAYAGAFQPLSSKPVNSAYAKDHLLKTARCTDTNNATGRAAARAQFHRRR